MTAVIAAAGSGERLGAGGPKAFVPLAGRPMIEWSLDALRASSGIRAIVVAVPPGLAYEPAPDEPHGSESPLAPIAVEVVAGGDARADSVANALAAVETEAVAIHDAARPLVTPDLISGVIATLEADPAAAGAIAATPVTDTIKRSDAPRAKSAAHGTQDFALGETVDRESLWAAQTPQVFRTQALRDAIEAAPAGLVATDESMLVEANGGRVLIHEAPAENLKVTTPADLAVAGRILAERAG